MRKFNAVLTAVIMVLFLIHAILGAFQMMGIGNTVLKALSWAAMGLAAVHMIIGVRLTADTLRAQKSSGVSYFRENRLFWARRISGFAVMVLLFFHMSAFGYYADGAYRLQWFNTGRLITQILLVVTLAVHIISNVRPVMISFGIRSLKEWAGDILFVLSVLFVFMAAAFIIYYLRWNAF